MKHPISRRQFLSQSGKMIAGTMMLGNLPVSPLFAQEGQRAPLLIHIVASGGAHSLMGLNPLLLADLYGRKIDPVPNDKNELYPTYSDDQLIKTPQHLLGVAADPLVPVAGDITLVNGVMMLADAPIHELNERFMVTGDEDGREAEFVAQMQRQFDASVFGIATSRLTYAQGLSTPLKSIPLNDLNNGTAVMGKMQLMLAQAQAGDDSNLGDIKRQLPLINRRFTQSEKIARTMQSYTSDSAFINTLLPAMAADVVNYAVIDPQIFGLDTHTGHDVGQKQSQRQLWTIVANLIQASKAIPEGTGSLYDRMVIMVTTEFARTSWVEFGDGTDHNPHNNSVLLSGGLIKNGVNIGQSTVIPRSRIVSGGGSDGRSRLQALPFNFETATTLNYVDGIGFASSVETREKVKDGQAKTDYIFPGNVLKTVALAMGLQPGQKFNKYQTLNSLLKA